MENIIEKTIQGILVASIIFGVILTIAFLLNPGMFADSFPEATSGEDPRNYFTDTAQ